MNGATSLRLERSDKERADQVARPLTDVTFITLFDKLLSTEPATETARIFSFARFIHIISHSSDVGTSPFHRIYFENVTGLVARPNIQSALPSTLLADLAGKLFGTNPTEKPFQEQKRSMP